MKKVFAILVSAGLVLGLASVAFAGEKPAPVTAPLTEGSLRRPERSKNSSGKNRLRLALRISLMRSLKM